MSADAASGGERPIDVRRRRAIFRANHRGTKEMDWMIGKFADAVIGDMDEAALGEFEQFLAISDPELQKWLLEGLPMSGDFAPLVHRIRNFHGLDKDEAR